MRKRLVGSALSIAAVSALVVSTTTLEPIPAFAAEGGIDAIQSGQLSVSTLPGENAPDSSYDPLSEAVKGDGWTLDAGGVLTIEKNISNPAGGDYEWSRYDKRVVEVRLAEGVTALPDLAFASSAYGENPINYSNLKRFSACSTLKTIGLSAFAGVGSLTEVHLNDGLESVGHTAFSETGITSIELPDNVTWGGDCFANCRQLKGTLVIPGGSKFEEGSNGTFWGVGVDTVIVEEGVTWIPNSAFNGCPNLKRIYLPKSVVQIGGAHEGTPGIHYASIDPCTIVGYKGTAAEQYVDHWLEVNPGDSAGLSFHAIDGEKHEFGPWEVISEATCTDAGARKHACAVCGAERTESLPALGHTWGEGIITAEPTANAEGERTFTCGRCGVARTESIAKLEQKASDVSDGKVESADDNLPATGDPASMLGLLTAFGTAVSAVGTALRRRKD